MKKGVMRNSGRLINGFTGLIAERCGCDPDYVRKVLSGSRQPKTDRAVKAKRVLEEAEKIKEAINQ